MHAFAGGHALDWRAILFCFSFIFYQSTANRITNNANIPANEIARARTIRSTLRLDHTCDDGPATHYSRSSSNRLHASDSIAAGAGTEPIY